MDATLPAGASPAGRTVKVLEHCTDVLRRIHGVAHTLALTENPFDLASDQPCVLVGLDPADRERTGPVVPASARRDLRVIDDALTPGTRPFGAGADSRAGLPDTTLPSAAPRQPRCASSRTDWPQRLQRTAAD